MTISLIEQHNRAKLIKAIDRSTNFYNFGTIVARIGGLLCRIIITLPLGLVFVLFGLIVILISLPFRQINRNKTKRWIYILISKYEVYDLLALSEFIPNEPVIEIINKMIKQDIRLYRYTLSNDGTRIEKKGNFINE